jgi:hypothetical protein
LPRPSFEAAVLFPSAAGISGPGFLSVALPLSYSNFRHWWESNPQPPEPDVTRAFTTPQTLPSFFFPPYFTSLPHYSSSRHTHSVTLRSNISSAPSASAISGRNQRSRSFRIRTRAFRPCHRSNRELHHPGLLFFSETSASQ